MKRRIDPGGLFVCALVGAGLFVTGAAAQHQDHQDQAPMAHMQMMMADQKETAMLVDQLVASFASIEAEKDPEVLKQELAEHGRMLRELQAKIHDHSHSMEVMHQKSGSDSKQ